MIQGSYTAIITPFNEDGTLDYAALTKLLHMQVEHGIDGIVAVGTTGESPTVSHKENIDIVKHVIETVGSRVSVIAGTGSNSTAEAINMTKQAADIGAHYSLQVCPYYNKPNQEGFYKHFSRIADFCPIPIIIYNVPGRTGSSISNNTILRLARHERIVAVKEASGDLIKVSDLISRKPSDFSVLSGNDDSAFMLCALGGQGVISVASNVAPKRVATMIHEILNDDLAQARKLHHQLSPLFSVLFCDANPIPVKYALAEMKFCKEFYRLPLSELAEDKKHQVKAVLASLSLV